MMKLLEQLNISLKMALLVVEAYEIGVDIEVVDIIIVIEVIAVKEGAVNVSTIKKISLYITLFLRSSLQYPLHNLLLIKPKVIHLITNQDSTKNV